MFDNHYDVHLRSTSAWSNSMRYQILAALLTAFAIASFVDSAAAQARQANRPPAITDPAQAGPDFLLQGEYAGWMVVPGRSREHTGLQVVALGDGRFDAVAYRGGLPGNGWDLATKAKL